MKRSERKRRNKINKYEIEKLKDFGAQNLGDLRGANVKDQSIDRYIEASTLSQPSN